MKTSVLKRILYFLLSFIVFAFVGVSLTVYSSFDTQGNALVFFSTKLFLLCLAVSLFLSLITSLANAKLNFFDRFFSFLYNTKAEFLLFLAELLFSVIVAFPVEFVLSRFVFGIMSTGGFFNRYRFLFIVAVVFVIVFGIVTQKRNKLTVEKMFAVLSVAVGIVIIFASPLKHISWDTESHFRFSVQESGISGYITGAESEIIGNSSSFLFDKSKTNAKSNEDFIKFLNEYDKVTVNNIGKNLSVPHIPSAMVLSVCRILKFSFYTRFCLGKLVNLLLYTLIIYYAIKKLKSGKTVMFVTALFPTNVFLAANYSYDWWMTAFIMLGTAYFLSECAQPDKELTVTDSLVMCGAFAIGCLPKQVCFPLLFIPFTLKKNYFSLDKRAKKRHTAICVSALAFLLILFAVSTLIQIKNGGDARGGSNISPSGQLVYIFTNPMTYTKILVTFIRNYLSLDNGVYVNFLAYLGTASFYSVYWVLLFVAVFTDKNEYDKEITKLGRKLFSYSVFFVCVCFVATTLYLVYTPVGSTEILGCQQRYLLPLIFPLVCFMGSYKITNHIPKKIYNLFFYAAVSLLLFSNIYTKIVSLLV